MALPLARSDTTRSETNVSPGQCRSGRFFAGRWARVPTRTADALFGSPALSASGDGRLELFVGAIDRTLWHMWQTAWSDGWSGWSLRGGPWPAATQPVAAAPSG